MKATLISLIIAFVALSGCLENADEPAPADLLPGASSPDTAMESVASEAPRPQPRYQGTSGPQHDHGSEEAGSHNVAPQALLNIDVWADENGNTSAPLRVNFTLDAVDVDRDAVQWVFDVDGDGNIDYSGEALPKRIEYTYYYEGTYLPYLIVHDNEAGDLAIEGLVDVMEYIEPEKPTPDFPHAIPRPQTSFTVTRLTSVGQPVLGGLGLDAQQCVSLILGVPGIGCGFEAFAPGSWDRAPFLIEGYNDNPNGGNRPNIFAAWLTGCSVTATELAVTTTSGLPNPARATLEGTVPPGAGCVVIWTSFVDIPLAHWDVVLG